MSSTNVLERIWTKATGDTDEECWNYHGSADTGGYRRIRLDDKSRMKVHRLAWEAFHAEPIPEGMVVMHKCDNPQCFNPHHLTVGTQMDNMLDMRSKGRHNYTGRPRK